MKRHSSPILEATLIALAAFVVLATRPALAQAPAPDPVEAYREAAASIERDLRTALDELAVLRETIAAEKPAIAAEAETVAAELREARRRAELARTTKDAAEAEFEKAEGDLKAWRDERLYVESLFSDFRRTWQSHQGFFAPSDGGPPEAGGPSLDLPGLAIESLARGGRIESVPGEVVAADGRLVSGRFAKAGPVHWFLSEEGSLAGLAEEGPDLRPRLVRSDIPPSAVAALLSGASAAPAFDPTLGTAAVLAESTTGFLEHVKQGGFWVAPILLLAAIALLAALLKWAQLARIREFGAAAVARVVAAVNEGRPEEAMAASGAIRHPARLLLERGVGLLEEKPGLSREDLEEALFERYLESVPALQRGLPLIAIASATAPLLGLLGTVTGMMETFRLITVFGTGDAKSLASGISEALVTTEFGLAVAIPALIAHSLLSRKVQGIKSVMEMTSLAFLNGLRRP